MLTQAFLGCKSLKDVPSGVFESSFTDRADLLTVDLGQPTESYFQQGFSRPYSSLVRISQNDPGTLQVFDLSRACLPDGFFDSLHCVDRHSIRNVTMETSSLQIHNLSVSKNGKYIVIAHDKGLSFYEFFQDTQTKKNTLKGPISLEDGNSVRAAFVTYQYSSQYKKTFIKIVYEMASGYLKLAQLSSDPTLDYSSNVMTWRNRYLSTVTIRSFQEVVPIKNSSQKQLRNFRLPTGTRLELAVGSYFSSHIGVVLSDNHFYLMNTDVRPERPYTMQSPLDFKYHINDWLNYKDEGQFFEASKALSNNCIFRDDDLLKTCLLEQSPDSQVQDPNKKRFFKESHAQWFAKKAQNTLGRILQSSQNPVYSQLFQTVTHLLQDDNNRLPAKQRRLEGAYIASLDQGSYQLNQLILDPDRAYVGRKKIEVVTKSKLFDSGKQPAISEIFLTNDLRAIFTPKDQSKPSLICYDPESRYCGS